MKIFNTNFFVVTVALVGVVIIIAALLSGLLGETTLGADVQNQMRRTGFAG